MRETNKDDLKTAYRSEKDSRIRVRIPAVRMVRARKKGISETATDLMQPERWVHDWLKRYDEGGFDGLSGIFPEAAGSCRPAAERHRQTTHRRFTRQQSCQM